MEAWSSTPHPTAHVQTRAACGASETQLKHDEAGEHWWEGIRLYAKDD